MKLTHCVYKVPIYAIAQLTGSIAASFCLRVLLQQGTYLGTTTPSGTNEQALIMEIIVTFTMMFVTSAVATDSKAVRIPRKYIDLLENVIKLTRPIIRF